MGTYVQICKVKRKCTSFCTANANVKKNGKDRQGKDNKHTFSWRNLESHSGITLTQDNISSATVEMIKIGHWEWKMLQQ